MKTILKSHHHETKKPSYKYFYLIFISCVIVLSFMVYILSNDADGIIRCRNWTENINEMNPEESMNESDGYESKGESNYERRSRNDSY